MTTTIQYPPAPCPINSFFLNLLTFFLNFLVFPLNFLSFSSTFSVFLNFISFSSTFSVCIYFFSVFLQLSFSSTFSVLPQLSQFFFNNISFSSPFPGYFEHFWGSIIRSDMPSALGGAMNCFHLSATAFLKYKPGTRLLETAKCVSCRVVFKPPELLHILNSSFRFLTITRWGGGWI